MRRFVCQVLNHRFASTGQTLLKHVHVKLHSDGYNSFSYRTMVVTWKLFGKLLSKENMENGIKERHFEVSCFGFYSSNYMQATVMENQILIRYCLPKDKN